MDKLQFLNDRQLPFAKVLGLKFTAASETGVTAEMVVRPELCTRPDILHGGAVIGFLDTIMGHFAASSAKRPTATIGFDCRFLASAPPGAWIEGRVIMRRLARTLAFVDGEALADGKLLVAASGIFKVFEG